MAIPRDPALPDPKIFGLPAYRSLGESARGMAMATPAERTFRPGNSWLCTADRSKCPALARSAHRHFTGRSLVVHLFYVNRFRRRPERALAARL